MSNWNNIKVRHDDSRTGRIKDRGQVLWLRDLDIVGDDGAVLDTVHLNSNYRDHGATGWWFLSDDNGREPMWIQLGDHWTPEVMI